jgi:hypothetical protein
VVVHNSYVTPEDIANFYKIERVNQSVSIVEKNNIVNFAKEVTKDEVVAIHRYTLNNFELSANFYKNTLSELEKSWVKLINSGLDKMSATKLFKGTVYRGSNLPEQLIISKYEQPFLNAKAAGGTAKSTEAAFWSTSKSPAVADDFIERFGSPSSSEAFFKIESKTGVYIDDISDYGKKLGPTRHPNNLIQQEVLMRNGLEYEIKNVTKTNLLNGKVRYEISLKEL